jgi:hypothetical protein
VVFGLNLLGEFQRAVDPTLKTYEQPATLPFEVFTCGAILGRSGHHFDPAPVQKTGERLGYRSTCGERASLPVAIAINSGTASHNTLK